jgi:hypothetical protein
MKLVILVRAEPMVGTAGDLLDVGTEPDVGLQTLSPARWDDH